MDRGLIEGLLNELLTSETGKKVIAEIIKSSVYEVNIKKDKETGEVTITIVLKFPAPGEKMLFLLT